MKHLNFLVLFFLIAFCFAGNEATTEENTAIAVDERAKDSEIILHAAPNPFSKATSIQFQVPVEGQVKLTVFGSTGQEIKNLYEGNATAETEYKIDFNASELIPGIYFYKLESGNGQVQVNKLLVANN